MLDGGRRRITRVKYPVRKARYLVGGEVVRGGGLSGWPSVAQCPVRWGLGALNEPNQPIRKRHSWLSGSVTDPVGET